ncbi:rod shape-determining protein MreD [Pedobacter cryophilus]|uniref:Rod shape-determining protein MreD n=1 Tax=Pedobacter cryophilus TaxID=2571271 RepID=A0A4U1C116_9SPHI|nr:rod shape-determining protein MreD [Pedobacter cryophilus]TKB98725.1 rod shape-determining protein MreD [Pedobacter cryophilus]
MNKFIINTLRFLILVFIQIFLLKNMVIYNLNVPYLYILFILLLPFETPNWLLFFLAFLIGITVDVFNDTLGLHATACSILVLVRVLFISITVQKDNYDSDPEPSLSIMGFRWFFFYALILTLIHHFFLLNFEVFKFSEIPSTLSRVLFSSIFTVILIFVSELLFYRKKQRK